MLLWVCVHYTYPAAVALNLAIVLSELEVVPGMSGADVVVDMGVARTASVFCLIMLAIRAPPILIAEQHSSSSSKSHQNQVIKLTEQHLHWRAHALHTTTEFWLYHMYATSPSESDRAAPCRESCSATLAGWLTDGVVSVSGSGACKLGCVDFT